MCTATKTRSFQQLFTGNACETARLLDLDCPVIANHFCCSCLHQAPSTARCRLNNNTHPSNKQHTDDDIQLFACQQKGSTHQKGTGIRSDALFLDE
eukprot:IDg13557t1